MKLKRKIRNLTKIVSIRADFTADQWGLFTCSMDCGPAAANLNYTLETAVNDRDNTRSDVYRIISNAMSKWADYGATDSEPEHFVGRVLDDIYGEYE